MKTFQITYHSNLKMQSARGLLIIIRFDSGAN